MRWGYVPLLALAVWLIQQYGAQSAQFKQQELAQRQFLSTLDASVKQLPPALLESTRQQGLAWFDADPQPLSELDVATALMRHQAAIDASYGWEDKQGRLAILSAPGLDWQHHFANSYLVGVRPFATENDWLPLYSLAQRKIYQLDSEQHQGRRELWQNSAQAWQALRGDCEDHAILLADWLISEGIDARVVVGKYQSEGHAWVVAIRQGQAFLLEATDKRLGKSWNHYPLASLNQHYQPEMMFNRKQFWVNTGSKDRGDYLGQHWQLRATYQNIFDQKTAGDTTAGKVSQTDHSDQKSL